MDEANPQALRRFLQPLVQRLGVSVIVTDDLASFRSVSDKLGLEHQVCQFHVRRWVGRTLHELKDRVPKEWLWVLDEIKRLLAERPVLHPGEHPVSRFTGRDALADGGNSGASSCIPHFP